MEEPRKIGDRSIVRQYDTNRFSAEMLAQAFQQLGNAQESLSANHDDRFPVVSTLYPEPLLNEATP